MKQLLLSVPYIEQTKTSANCGPCSVQSILEYFDIKKQDGTPYSTQSINRLCKTTKEFGAEEEDIMDFFTSVGLKYKLIKFSEIDQALERKNPILAAFEDEVNEGHFAVICGFEEDDDGNKFFIFQDPWPEFGEHFKRESKKFKEQLKKFNNWMLEVFST